MFNTYVLGLYIAFAPDKRSAYLGNNRVIVSYLASQSILGV